MVFKANDVQCDIASTKRVDAVWRQVMDKIYSLSLNVAQAQEPDETTQKNALLLLQWHRVAFVYFICDNNRLGTLERSYRNNRRLIDRHYSLAPDEAVFVQKEELTPDEQLLLISLDPAVLVPATTDRLERTLRYLLDSIKQLIRMPLTSNQHARFGRILNINPGDPNLPPKEVLDEYQRGIGIGE